MSYDAIIIGGGCAGLSAAAALAGSGARVLVVEARPGLGGRATAFTDPETGERVDNGQHILMGCYDATFAFLRRSWRGRSREVAKRSQGADDRPRRPLQRAARCRRCLRRCTFSPAYLAWRR
ncbi:MAG: FAD-dependent oxidoreductase [Hymenobacter sp.]